MPKKNRCSICQNLGHYSKTCPNKDAKTLSVPPVPKEVERLVDNGETDESKARSEKIRKLLLEGMSVDDVAREVDTSAHIVRFIRRGMVGRGEIAKEVTN